MCNDNKNSNTVSFAIGAMLGAGAGVFLSTKKGRKLVKQAWKQVGPYVDEAVDNAKDEFEGVKARAEDKMDRTVNQVKDFADEKIPSGLKKSVKRTFFKGV